MFGSVQLQPGVNVERTPTTLRAGYSSAQFIRFLNGLAQKYGGWQRFYQFAISGVPRELHAWQDLNTIDRLAIGTTGTGTQLGVIANNVYQDITPQTLVSNFAPNFSTTINTPTVAVIDPNIANVTTFDSVFFNVPISIGGLILDGLYPITEITGTDSYQITASSNATETVTNPTATNAGTSTSSNILHFASTPSWIAAGMVAFNLTHPTAITPGTYVTAVGPTTVTLSANAASPGVSSGDNIVFASVPLFTTTNGSFQVSVEFLNHGLTANEDEVVVFPLSTTGGGVTIQGTYDVVSVADVNDFSIGGNSLATSGTTFAMNNGEAQLTYYLAMGPLPGGQGYGLGGYGDGGYGLGENGSDEQTGTEITATDWTIDNWGSILIANPKGGPIYCWDPASGFQNAQIISGGPPINNGCFVSTVEQILIAWGSSIHQNIGWQQQPLLLQWSDVSNFLNWQATAATQAGNIPVSRGSRIMQGMAVANQNLILTDLDLWAMPYIGVPDVFGLNLIGEGMGCVSPRAAQILWGSVFWMGPTNFYGYSSGGPSVLPCPVWDAVFQNLNTNYLQNVRAMPNTPFNEAGWLFPSLASTSGENDSYVKMNINEPGAPWDIGIGVLPRSAWTDQSVLGMPIGATPGGVIYQHETTQNADGQPINSSFTTGYFFLSEGEDFVTVDQIYPDFKWTEYPGGTSAQIQLTFLVVNYPGDTPTAYGPYLVTQDSPQFISVRFRGRQMAIQVETNDLNSFYRLGYCRYRYSTTGRR